jgi:hypothetical protein
VDFAPGYPRYSVRKFMNRWHVFWQSAPELQAQPLPGGGFDTQVQAMKYLDAQKLARQKEWDDLIARMKPEKEEGDK